MAAPQTAQDRLAFVDHMKAIGIVAITLGHAPGITPDLVTILYGFHVPLFFFVSGILLAEQKLNVSPTAYLARQAREILIPYAVFFLISYLYWLATRHYGNSAERFAETGWAEPFAGLLVGTGASLYVNNVLWFFPALFCARLLYYAVRRISGDRLALAVFFLLAVAHTLWFGKSSLRLWFGVDCALYGVVFLATGRLCRSVLSHIHDTGDRMSLAAASVLFSVIFLVAAMANGKSDLNNVITGHLFLYFLAAVTGCMAAFCLSCLIPANACSRWLSSHTLYIFPLHALFFKATTGVLQVFFAIPSPYATGSAAWAVLYMSVGIALVAPAAWVLNRLPFPPFTPLRRGGLHAA